MRYVICFIIALLTLLSWNNPAHARWPWQKESVSTASISTALRLPAGFHISIYASGLTNPRFMAWGPDAGLYVSEMRAGRVTRLKDTTGDGLADTQHIVIDGLTLPHGLSWYDGHLWVAEEARVIRLAPLDTTFHAATFDVIVDGIPAGGHRTRTIGHDADGFLYLSIGSLTNVSIETDARRATITRYQPDGSGETIFAEGLRNAVGFRWHPETGQLWATDNGRDWLGDELPPDELNLVVAGGDYGWPYCYGRRVPDPEFGSPQRCAGTQVPSVNIQAHSAPLGLEFAYATNWPEPYRSSCYIAFHGSWNRSQPTGYKVVRVSFHDGQPSGGVEDFISGWLDGRTVRGRPVDVTIGPDGAMYVTDDKAGLVYRIWYEDA